MSGVGLLTTESFDGIGAAPVPSAGVRRPGAAWFVPGGLALIGAALLAAAWIVQLTVAERQTVLESHLAGRLEALARGRAEVLATWLDGIERSAARVTGSELFRLFVREAALARTDGSLAASLAEQMPYMAQVLDELAAQQGLTAVHLLAADGAVLTSDRNAAAAGPALVALARAAASAPGAARVGTARRESGALVVDVALPIPAPPTDSVEPDVVAGRAGVGAVVLSVPAAEPFRRVLGPSELDAPGETVRLVVPGETAGSWSMVEPRGQGAADVVLAPARAEAETGAARGLRVRESGWPQPVYAAARPVPGTAWSLVQAIDREAALAPLRRYEEQARAWAAGAALGLALLLAAGWWWQSSRHYAAMTAQYRDLAARIDRQRRLLESITASVPDMIGLKGRDGRYVFANAAFGRALARSPAEIVGRSDTELFPPATARLWDRTDREALALGIVVVEDERVEIAGTERWLHHAKVPLVDPSGAVGGVVSVARDVTDLTLQRRRRERLVEQTVAALVRTIELADPWLLGHSQRLGEVAAAIGHRLGLDTAEMTTLRLAASLSQIGKIFVPRELLTKPGRHSDAEIAVMRGHVEHALSVLRGIEFELPVAEAIAQMHERLDGTGYPRGLRAEAIGRLGRILAVADVFCARTAPRSYRDRVPVATALHHLAAHPQRYDPAVVAALAAAVPDEPAATEPDPDVAGPGSPRAARAAHPPNETRAPAAETDRPTRP